MSSLGEFGSGYHDDMLFDFDIFTEQASDSVLGPQFAAGPSPPQLPPSTAATHAVATFPLTCSDAHPSVHEADKEA